MEKTLPNLVAFLCTAFECEIYESYSSEFNQFQHPLLPSYIIRIGIYFIILQWPLYSSKLRKLLFVCEFLYRLIVSIFIYETLMVHVWFNIENLLFDVLQLICVLIDYKIYKRPHIIIKLNYRGFQPPGLNFYLVCASLLVSSTFLCCVLHLTCVANFSLILRGKGFIVFTREAYENFKKGITKMIPFTNCVSNISIHSRKCTQSGLKCKHIK